MGVGTSGVGRRSREWSWDLITPGRLGNNLPGAQCVYQFTRKTSWTSRPEVGAGDQVVVRVVANPGDWREPRRVERVQELRAELKFTRPLIGIRFSALRSNR